MTRTGDTALGLSHSVPPTMLDRLSHFRRCWLTELVFPEFRDRGAQRGILAGWLAADGSSVRVGDRLARVQVDGTDAEVRALATGTLWHQAEPGEVLSPGAVVGLID